MKPLLNLEKWAKEAQNNSDCQVSSGTIGTIMKLFYKLVHSNMVVETFYHIRLFLAILGIYFAATNHLIVMIPTFVLQLIIVGSIIIWYRNIRWNIIKTKIFISLLLALLLAQTVIFAYFESKRDHPYSFLTEQPEDLKYYSWKIKQEELIRDNGKMMYLDERIWRKFVNKEYHWVILQLKASIVNYFIMLVNLLDLSILFKLTYTEHTKENTEKIDDGANSKVQIRDV